MKPIFSTIFALCLLNTQAQSNDNEQKVKASVESVVVYLNGAEITQNKNLALEAGRNTIIFTGISSRLVSKSIQINAGTDVSILSISDKINYLNNAVESPKIKQLKDSIKLLYETIEQLTYEKDAYDTEKKMLLQNEMMGGKEKAVAIAELKLAADFYRSRIKEINTEVYKLDKKVKPCNETIERLNREITELNGKPATPTAEITVLLNANAKTTLNMELKYLVGSAGWAPAYDLIAEDVNKPIELKYRAKVYNNTNVDWKNVKMKLSTANPTLNASKPQLAAWYLNFANEYDNMNMGGVPAQYGDANGNIQVRGARSGSTNIFIDGERVIENEEAKKKTESNSKKQQSQKGNGGGKINPKYEEVQVSELSAEFEIKNTYSIPADAKPYIVEVTNYNLPATFKYYSIPKTEKEAFLLARITGWEQLDLVEGPANIYFSGNYVGQSYIYTRSLDDTLDLSLGRDKKVQVSRTKKKDFNSKSFSGANKKETESYEIVIKNSRKLPITIDVEDQLPVSQNSEIIVEAEEISKAKKDDATGKLTWTYTINTGEQQKITLTYSIKYPKNKIVPHKKYRSVSAPSF